MPTADGPKKTAPSIMSPAGGFPRRSRRQRTRGLRGGVAVVAVEVAVGTVAEATVGTVAEAEVGTVAEATVETVAEAIVETAAVATTETPAVPIPVRVPAAATRGRQHRKPLW